jgi:hypothetical protein
MFRQSIRLRKVLGERETRTDTLDISVLVNEGLIAMDEFESTYGQFCENCTCEFYRLSRAAKVSSGMFLQESQFALLMCLSILNTVLDFSGSLCCRASTHCSSSWSHLAKLRSKIKAISEDCPKSCIRHFQEHREPICQRPRPNTGRQWISHPITADFTPCQSSSDRQGTGQCN